MTIKIEMTESPDAEVIAAIHDACFPLGWSAAAISDMLAINGTKAFVVHDGSGFALLRLITDEAEILTLCVLEEHRGQGVGSALVNALSVWAKAHGGLKLLLEVSEHNIAARRLYEKAGFAVIAQRREYYQAEDGSHVHALVMRLLL